MKKYSTLSATWDDDEVRADLDIKHISDIIYSEEGILLRNHADGLHYPVLVESVTFKCCPDGKEIARIVCKYIKER